MPLKDLTGQKFGRLTILKRDESKPKGCGKPVFWICECDCGNVKSIRGDHIKSGATQSCGCLQKEKSRAALIKDLTGQKFGRLTVINQDIRVKGHEAYWNCICDCGNKVIVSGYQLRTGRTKSCGCYNKERITETRLIDLTNQRFDRLTVLERDLSRKNEGKIYWICKCDCGNLCSVSSSALRTGLTRSCGCLKSLGEEKIIKILTENNYIFKTQYTFEDLKKVKPLRFDFAIFDDLNNLIALIEYQGQQHFLEKPYGYYTEEKIQKIKENDSLKRKYCKKNNIKLIEINYKDFNKIDNKYLEEKIYG